jgi:hypothetical protein
MAIIDKSTGLCASMRGIPDSRANLRSQVLLTRVNNRYVPLFSPLPHTNQ